MPILDISPLISARLAVWPGDVPFRREITCAFTGGANLDLSSTHGTVHLGAHTDAPSHYHPDGVGIDARPLERYYGPCEVIRVEVARGERIRPEHLPHRPTAPRVLLHTGTFPDPEAWNNDFAALSPELVHWLADAGVQLVGIDTPSVDLFDDKALVSHQAIYARDLAVLEGIVLDAVAPGLYTLIALPLRIEGADASPVRAALVAP